MKKFTFLLALIGVLFSSLSYAGNGDLFTYDKEKVKMEMADLVALESMVSQDQTVTYQDLLEVNNPLVTGLDYGSNMMLGMSSGPIIPAFWWGCLFGPVGILVVYLVEDDSSQTKSAFWGCLVNVLISGTTTGFYYALAAANM
jgi:hypothetical protein